MFYIENKNGIYPLNASLIISKVGKFIDKDGNVCEKFIDGIEVTYISYYDVRHLYDVITTFDTEQEAQNLIEKIQEAVNNGESHYYVNEV